MKVKQLIEILSTLEEDKDVSVFWDGGARGDIEGVVNDDNQVVIVGEWCIYRKGTYRAYAEEKIVYSCDEGES